MTGLELRGCWAERPAGSAAARPVTSRPPTAPDPGWRELPVRDFVPVCSEPATPPALPAYDVPLAAVEPAEAWDPSRFSLFGEAEP